MNSRFKDTSFFDNNTINIKGKLFSLEKPLVMGILNLTEDSFFDGGKYTSLDLAIKRAEEIVEEGAEIIDIGACSTRPGAKLIEKQEEIERIVPVVKQIKKRFPKIPISIDTVWAEIVEKAYNEGADIVNDISGGEWDENLFETVAQYRMPYILMHNTDKPDLMQNNTNYENLFLDMASYFADKITTLRNLGVKDIILDLGFGFGKTMEQNYELLRRQKEFEVFSLPILTGISRKSMIYKPLDISASQALNGTCFLHAFALENGANILRVHDVKTAKECIKLYSLYKNNMKK